MPRGKRRSSPRARRGKMQTGRTQLSAFSFPGERECEEDDDGDVYDNDDDDGDDDGGQLEASAQSELQDGQPCGNVVNTAGERRQRRDQELTRRPDCPYCEYHVASEMKKLNS
eukprot:756861-Hanusia_phi.AAC.1